MWSLTDLALFTNSCVYCTALYTINRSDHTFVYVLRAEVFILFELSGLFSNMLNERLKEECKVVSSPFYSFPPFTIPLFFRVLSQCTFTLSFCLLLGERKSSAHLWYKLFKTNYGRIGCKQFLI